MLTDNGNNNFPGLSFDKVGIVISKSINTLSVSSHNENTTTRKVMNVNLLIGIARQAIQLKILQQNHIIKDNRINPFTYSFLIQGQNFNRTNTTFYFFYEPLDPC